jgi:UDP-N-acetyl-D-glucosamine dehydrogenase
MPEYVISRLTEALNEEGRPVRGSAILVLGVAYKRDVDDPRESPALELIKRLEDLGAVVSYHDPHIPRIPPMRAYDIDLDAVDLTESVVGDQDVVLLVTDHSAYDPAWIARHARLIVDTRNFFGDLDETAARIVKA